MRSAALSRPWASTYLRVGASAAWLVHVLSHVELGRVRHELPDLGPATTAWLPAALLATTAVLANLLSGPR